MSVHRWQPGGIGPQSCLDCGLTRTMTSCGPAEMLCPGPAVTAAELTTLLQTTVADGLCSEAVAKRIVRQCGGRVLARAS